MYEIVEHYNFVATHEISGLRPTHPCHGVHMHQWSVEVVLHSAGLLPTNAPAETSALEPLRRYVMSELEGRHLNDLLVGEPTPARLAGHLADWCRCHLAAFVVETLHGISVSAGRTSRSRYLVSRGQGNGQRGKRCTCDQS